MIIVTEKSGQLANRLFLFAHLIAFAKKNGFSIINPSFEEYAEYFETTERDMFCKFPPSLLTIRTTSLRRQKLFQFVQRWQGRITRRRLLTQLIRTVEITIHEKCDMSNKQFIKLARGKILLLRGWRYRDHSDFEEHAAVIRSYFKPIPQIQRNVMRLIEDCRHEGDILVGVHIRRGDYREHLGGIFYFDDQEYLLAMKKIQQIFPDQAVTFLICSNETVSEEAFRDVPYKLSTNHLVEDLYALAQCDYLIGPPSTFSHWASFYGQVPLFPLRPTTVLNSVSQFVVTKGNCDLPELYEKCSDFEVKV